MTEDSKIITYHEQILTSVVKTQIYFGWLQKIWTIKTCSKGLGETCYLG